MTHRSSVDENDYNDDKKDHNDCANDVPLVVLPNDELERLPWRRDPQKGGSWSVWWIELWIEVWFIPCFSCWAELRLLFIHNLKFQLQFSLDFVNFYQNTEVTTTQQTK